MKEALKRLYRVKLVSSLSGAANENAPRRRETVGNLLQENKDEPPMVLKKNLITGSGQ